ncbi:MAG: DoxX family protein [Rhodanobacter sp.]
MQDSADLGKLLLRVALGALILFHGVHKLLHGTGPVLGAVLAAGLPAWVSYGVYVGEVVAPILLLLGLWTRIAALVVAVNMLAAISLVHLGQIASLGGGGGWALELQGMYLAAALAIALLGAGRFSLGGRNGRWN